MRWLTNIILGLAILAAGLCTYNAARADSWSAPSTEIYLSEAKSHRLSVTPSPIESGLAYFTEELRASEQGEVVERTRPLAMLERKDDNGNWQPMWAKPLINHVAPVSALVSNDGSYFATFDNWHSVGFGENVIVLYTGEGELVASYALTDLVSEEYIAALPSTTSSVRWAKDKRIDEDNGILLIDMLIPSADPKNPDTILRKIDLATGAIIPPDVERAAFAQSRVSLATKMREEAEVERIRYLTEPLPAPITAEMREWHDYLREAFLRLTPDYLDSPSTATKILFPPDHERHSTSVEWLVGSFEDEADWGGSIAIASPASDDALLVALRSAADAIEKGGLYKTTLYLSIGAEHIQRARTILSRTKAEVVWLDPSRPIPQRPERVPGSPEEQAADEEIERRWMQGTNAMLNEL